MGTESWFNALWRTSKKATPENDKVVIGVLAFEVASLMSKVANLWHFLRDDEILRLREAISNSIGIQKLVSEDADYVMDLVLNEVLENFILLAKSVGRLGKKCVDPLFSRFENFANDPVENSFEWFGWDYRLKKMERKVKKMERFVSVTMQLAQKHEVLAELEQTLRRRRANPDLSRGKLHEIQQRVMWQRHEVRSLREMSPWVRTYDYIVRLLVRSLLTILQRTMIVFGNAKPPSEEEDDDYVPVNPTCLPRSHSISAVMQSSIYPSEKILCGRLDSISENKKYKAQFILPRKQPHCESFNEHTKICYFRSFDCSNIIYSKLALISSRRGLLDAPSSTLGHAGLSLHYAHVIGFIEKLYSLPHMIESETRDELYNMLPTTIRAALKTKLKLDRKFQALSAKDASLTAEWIRGVTRILQWLSPLSHNMIRWHSERSFEREREVSSTNVLLVQTLHYASQVKTEAAIVELLLGLSYICRIIRDPHEIAQAKSSEHGVGFYHMLKRERDYL